MEIHKGAIFDRLKINLIINYHPIWFNQKLFDFIRGLDLLGVQLRRVYYYSVKFYVHLFVLIAIEVKVCVFFYRTAPYHAPTLDPSNQGSFGSLTLNLGNCEPRSGFNLALWERGCGQKTATHAKDRGTRTFIRLSLLIKND
jgi:hypothetical protein